MSACSFVSSAVNQEKPLTDEESQLCVREDVAVVDRSLRFINDLLRSMLDVHRCSSNRLELNTKPTDILRDVLEPSAAMLYLRGDDIEVQIDCPEDLVVMADRLRLKQVRSGGVDLFVWKCAPHVIRNDGLRVIRWS